MPLSEEIITGSHSIQAYDDGQITISERIYTDSLVVSADDIISPWPVPTIEELRREHLNCIFDLKPDVVLLGSGETQIFPDIEILGCFAQQNLGVEVMNNGALCRTFNILVAEGRRVVAAIIQPV
jgi:uncharacterized protein